MPNEEMGQELIKPEGYPTPGRRVGLVSRCWPCRSVAEVSVSPSISISYASACSSQLLYCPLVATWLWLTFTPALHLIKWTHPVHGDRLSGSGQTQTHCWTHSSCVFWASKMPLTVITGPDKALHNNGAVAEPLLLSSKKERHKCNTVKKNMSSLQ